MQEMWCELDSQSAFDQALQDLPDGKMLIVDYYAPWCAVCKTAFPALCRIADNKDYQQDYVFCKASLQAPEVKAWVKAEGITGIPHLSIYNQSGKKLLGMGASFKKMEALKSNLQAIVAHKDVIIAEGRELQLDPNAFVVPPQPAKVPQ